MKPIDIQGETPISVTDYEAKAKHIIDTLDTEIFNAIDKEDCFETTVSKSGSETKKKRSTKKNELMPTLSPALVAFKLDMLLRMYMPMNDGQAKMVEPQEYALGYVHYCSLLFHINKYLIFNGNKPYLCAFFGITSDIYNDLCADPTYSSVFKSFEDGLVGTSLLVGESGLLDSKMVATKLGAVGQGHSMKKADTTNVFIQHNRVDKMLVQSRLDEFTKMIEGK